jgi:hypothetical protein
MLKRIHEVIAVMLFLAGTGGMLLGLHFLYVQRFIEGMVAGLLAFVMLRTGLLILRLMVARSSLSEAHRRVLEYLGESGERTEPPDQRKSR